MYVCTYTVVLGQVCYTIWHACSTTWSVLTQTLAQFRQRLVFVPLCRRRRPSTGAMDPEIDQKVIAPVLFFDCFLLLLTLLLSSRRLRPRQRRLLSTYLAFPRPCGTSTSTCESPGYGTSGVASMMALSRVYIWSWPTKRWVAILFSVFFLTNHTLFTRGVAGSSIHCCLLRRSKSFSWLRII